MPGVCQAGGVRRAAHHFFSAALMPVLTVLPHREGLIRLTLMRTALRTPWAGENPFGTVGGGC